MCRSKGRMGKEWREGRTERECWGEGKEGCGGREREEIGRKGEGKEREIWGERYARRSTRVEKKEEKALP